MATSRAHPDPGSFLGRLSVLGRLSILGRSVALWGDSNFGDFRQAISVRGRSDSVGTKKTGKGRRKVGRKKRRMRAKIRHRKK